MLKGYEKRRTLVLFDIGAVLLELNFKKFYEEAAELSDKTDKEEFEKMYKESMIEEKYMKGRITTAEYFFEIKKILKTKEYISEGEMKKVVSYQWKAPINEVIEIKRKAYQAGYSMGLLSNINEFALEKVGEKYPDIFEVYEASFPKIFSFEVGFIKPEPEIYECIKGFEKIIFIDDKESYLKAPIERLNWHGILFTPFIDTKEAIRFIHNEKERPKERFKVAESVDELYTSLKEFGVDLI